jgi:hypothetical protein
MWTDLTGGKDFLTADVMAATLAGGATMVYVGARALIERQEERGVGRRQWRMENGGWRIENGKEARPFGETDGRFVWSRQLCTS